MEFEIIKNTYPRAWRIIKKRKNSEELLKEKK